MPSLSTILIYFRKARKEYICDRCGKVIKKGEYYYRYWISKKKTLKMFCVNCAKILYGDVITEALKVREELEKKRGRVRV